MIKLIIATSTLLAAVPSLARWAGDIHPVFPRYSYNVGCAELREAIGQNGAVYIYETQKITLCIPPTLIIAPWELAYGQRSYPLKTGPVISTVVWTK